MLGQIFLGIIIVLFLMGTGSIAISIWVDYDKDQYGSPIVYKEPAPVLKEVEYFYTDDDEDLDRNSAIDLRIPKEEKPISDILESFTMEDLDVQDDSIDLYGEELEE